MDLVSELQTGCGRAHDEYATAIQLVRVAIVVWGNRGDSFWNRCRHGGYDRQVTGPTRQYHGAASAPALVGFYVIDVSLASNGRDRGLRLYRGVVCLRVLVDKVDHLRHGHEAVRIVAGVVEPR